MAEGGVRSSPEQGSQRSEFDDESYVPERPAAIGAIRPVKLCATMPIRFESTPVRVFKNSTAATESAARCWTVEACFCPEDLPALAVVESKYRDAVFWTGRQQWPRRTIMRARMGRRSHGRLAYTQTYTCTFDPTFALCRLPFDLTLALRIIAVDEVRLVTL